MIRTERRDITFESGASYLFIEDFCYVPEVRGISFVHNKQRVETNVPYVLTTTVFLSCGHDPSNHYLEDNYSAGTQDRCEECDKIEAIHS